MLKAVSRDGNGKIVYLIGLSKENLGRMEAGDPAFINLEDIGGVGRLVIMSGDTEQSMVAQLKAAGIHFHEPHKA